MSGCNSSMLSSRLIAFIKETASLEDDFPFKVRSLMIVEEQEQGNQLLEDSVGHRHSTARQLLSSKQ